MPETQETIALARKYWNADRALFKVTHPEWPFPPWSRAPAWRRRAYLLAARSGQHPDQEQPEEDAT